MKHLTYSFISAALYAVSGIVTITLLECSKKESLSGEAIRYYFLIFSFTIGPIAAIIGFFCGGISSILSRNKKENYLRSVWTLMIVFLILSLFLLHSGIIWHL